ncbi:MAG: hypothetical protein ABGX16_08070 [Pirellulales bacterium]
MPTCLELAGADYPQDFQGNRLWHSHTPGNLLGQEYFSWSNHRRPGWKLVDLKSKEKRGQEPFVRSTISKSTPPISPTPIWAVRRFELVRLENLEDGIRRWLVYLNSVVESARFA